MIAVTVPQIRTRRCVGEKDRDDQHAKQAHVETPATSPGPCREFHNPVMLDATVPFAQQFNEPGIQISADRNLPKIRE
jgi:hypothetical protein